MFEGSVSVGSGDHYDGRGYDGDNYTEQGAGFGVHGHMAGGRNTVSGHELLTGRGRDSEGRAIEPQGQYVVTRDRGAERPPRPRMVLVEVPENQVPPGARVVGNAEGRSGGLGVELDGRDGGLDVDVDLRSEGRHRDERGGLFGRRGR